MRAVVQRVAEASVVVEEKTVGQIGAGLLVYVGVACEDTDEDAVLLAEKVARLRIFPDADDKLNQDVSQAGGNVLVVSAFTVQADGRKGRRPSFDAAAPPQFANELYNQFCTALAGFGLRVEQGVFRAVMDVRSFNAGPVCILLDSKRVF